MRKNKVLACMLAAAMVMTGVTLPGGSGWRTVAVEAAETGDTFTYGDFTCTYLEDGTIEISKYNGNDAEVMIPEEIDGTAVTGIGNNAFSLVAFSHSLTSIEIPDGVTYIGDCAFLDCYGLTSIEIPSSVTSIGSWAFGECSSLTSVKISEGVKEIKGSAFCSCTSLTSIEIPSSVTSIEAWAFSNCSSLTSVALPDGLATIGMYAFLGCTNLTDIIIPESVSKIGSGAFSGCNNLTIYGYTGTAAENYALENGFTFIALDEITLGDVNEDGAIDYFDAMAVLQYDAELIELTDIQLLAGDVNHDGSVDSFDAVKILQYDAELIGDFK